MRRRLKCSPSVHRWARPAIPDRLLCFLWHASLVSEQVRRAAAFYFVFRTNISNACEVPVPVKRANVFTARKPSRALSQKREGNGHWKRPRCCQTKNKQDKCVFLDFQRLSKPPYVKPCFPSRFECLHEKVFLRVCFRFLIWNNMS